MRVTVPAGSRGGDELQVETASGPMRVTIPPSLTPGDAFLVRPPPTNSQSIPVARPIGRARSKRARLGHQPNVTYVQQQQPIYVQRPPVYHSPRYYNRGYGYGDPLLAGGMGFLGGMLIADALFW